MVYEGRTVVAPRSATGPHPFIRVNFDARVYNDGKARVDVSVENLLDKDGARTATYDVAISFDGHVVLARNGLEHYYLTRWRKMFEIGHTPFASVIPDLAPFNAANALPPYLSTISNVVGVPSGAEYDLLGAGALNANMAAIGSRPEIAPYPDWTARYLVHRNPEQRSFVLANGDLSGSWPIHVPRNRIQRHARRRHGTTDLARRAADRLVRRACARCRNRLDQRRPDAGPREGFDPPAARTERAHSR